MSNVLYSTVTLADQRVQRRDEAPGHCRETLNVSSRDENGGFTVVSDGNAQA